MSLSDRAAFNELLRSSFSLFVERCFRQLHPGVPYYANWHIDMLAGDLEGVRAGRTRRLIVNLPPRHLKSVIASIAFPAWCLGHDPSLQIMCVSYAQDLADKLSRDCRRIMEADWYQSLFPGTRLSPQRNAVGEFTTTSLGSRFATSVGGVVTGRGADLIIIDDPAKPDEAYSETQRRAVNDWFDRTLISRLNNKQTGAILLIMQRLHEDDLVGHLLAVGEEWTHRKLAAIAADDECHVIRSPMGTWTHKRKQGEALHSEREPLAQLLILRRRMGEDNFSSQYQQEPTPPGGGIVKTAWFGRYLPGDLPRKFDSTMQSWDTANKASELADHSVCTTWGIRDRKLYLLHVLRARLEYPDLKRAVREQQLLHQADVVLIEDRASGTQLIQELQSDGFYRITLARASRR